MLSYIGQVFDVGIEEDGKRVVLTQRVHPREYKSNVVSSVRNLFIVFSVAKFSPLQFPEISRERYNIRCLILLPCVSHFLLDFIIACQANSRKERLDKNTKGSVAKLQSRLWCFLTKTSPPPLHQINEQEFLLWQLKISPFSLFSVTQKYRLRSLIRWKDAWQRVHDDWCLIHVAFFIYVPQSHHLPKFLK